MSMGFDKETFKKSVIYNVKNVLRKTIDEATPEQAFQAVAYAVKDVIIDEWIATHKEYEKQDAKTLYYLSMEFLMGRALGNNIINIMALPEVKVIVITKDEKEIREYRVDQLKFKPRRRKDKGSVADAELKALEALEKKEGKSKLDDN